MLVVRRGILPALAVSVVLAFACAGGGGGSRTGAIADRLAPDFSLPDLAGNTVRLSDSAGRVRLVDFWATWCAPCREEVPAFKELHKTYGDRGFTLLAISMDDEGFEDEVREFVAEYDIPYTNLLGNDDVAEAFGGVVGLPTAFLVDGEGKIVDTFVGIVPKKVLEKKIRSMLGEAAEVSGS